MVFYLFFWCEIFETACCFTWLIPSCLQISTDGSPNPMRWGQKEPVPALHPGWLYIQMGSCMSHFNVSLTVGDVITRHWPGVITIEEEGKPKGSQTKILSNFQLSDLPLRPGWLTVYDSSPSQAFLLPPVSVQKPWPIVAVRTVHHFWCESAQHLLLLSVHVLRLFYIKTQATVPGTLWDALTPGCFRVVLCHIRDKLFSLCVFLSLCHILESKSI